MAAVFLPVWSSVHPAGLCFSPQWLFCFSLPCCSCFSPSAFTGFLWFVVTGLSPPLPLCSRSQPDSTKCWSVTRSSIWDWWKTWESGEPASPTDAVMRSFCRGDRPLFLFKRLKTWRPQVFYEVSTHWWLKSFRFLTVPCWHLRV